MQFETIIFGGLNRLIMRKLICDCCGQEISESFDGLDLRPAAHLQVFKADKVEGQTETAAFLAENAYEFTDLNYDLCQFCTKKLLDFIKEGSVKRTAADKKLVDVSKLGETKSANLNEDFRNIVKKWD